MISIHVPTKGTTANMGDVPVYKSISIHVPTKGTTNTDSKSRWTMRDFNPRTHEGYDSTGRKSIYIYMHFNPRTHEGYDQLPPETE